MNLSAAIGAISGFNECVTLWQWAKSAISSLHSRWSGSQQQDLQGRVLELESDLQRLRDTLPAMHNLINKAEWRSHDSTVASLLPNLKDAVFDAEDLLDEFGWYEMKVQVEGNASQSDFTEFFDTVIQGNFNKLSDVQSRLNHLSRQLNNMGLPEVSEHFDKLVRPETTSFPNEKKIFGRDKELDQVLGFLNVRTSSKRKRAINVSTSSERKRATSLVNATTSTFASKQVSSESKISILPVLVIDGIGGVGKTTLAQHICSHQRVKAHFQLIVWICVSDDFDVRRLTKEVIQSCAGKEATTDNLDSLQRELSNHVNNKRFLIVLDDMWDDALQDNGRRWEKFCAPFTSAQEGSAMLVTTRCPKVTERVRTMEPVTVQGLKNDVFWNFFKLCAFGSVDSNNDPELERIGRSILPKLKGSPLAAKTLGRMLRMDLQASHWNSILESELWELTQEETDILPALRLSYMYLPLYLKQCFAFCAVYPKDYKFEKACLAEIWVAEGFVKPQGNFPVQDIGCQYFEDLVARSFFQKVNGRYVIHDLLHDMAQMVSMHNCFILRNDSDFDKVPQNVRHLYVLSSSDFDDSNLSRLGKYTKLRTLICMKIFGKENTSVMDKWCKKLLHIRVISFLYTRELPKSIGKWKHVRYLEISRACPLMKTIPSSFCCLYNLKILYAKKCRLESLPGDFGKLISLQKFETNGLASYAGGHTTLDSTKGNGQGIRLINNLNQFRGHLKITNVDKLSKDQAAEAELKNKKYIEGLRLTVHCLPPYSSELVTIHGNEIEVLEVLQPPISLKSLCLSNYAGVSLPSWFHPQNLPSLKSLTFVCCLGLKSISSPMISHSINSNEMPAIGIFMSLTDLTIDDCQNISNLEHLLHPDYVPAIKKIRIQKCEMLTSVPTDKFGDFRFLEELYVARCPNIRLQRLVSPSLKKLQMWSLPSLQKLTINCQSLTSIGGSIAAFSSLNVLRIEYCHKLSTLDDLLTQENLPAIEQICIDSCQGLLSLPGERFGSFPYLKCLEVILCPSLNWQRGLVLPSSLQSLRFKACGGVSPYIPSCLRNLTSLVSLEIISCQGITSIPGNIWRNNLVSLMELVICDCPDLDSIGGANAVANIKNVDIRRCPKIKEGEQIIRRSR